MSMAWGCNGSGGRVVHKRRASGPREVPSAGLPRTDTVKARALMCVELLRQFAARTVLEEWRLTMDDWYRANLADRHARRILAAVQEREEVR